MYDHSLFHVCKSDIGPQVKWAVSLVTRVNTLTLSPLRAYAIRTQYNMIPLKSNSKGSMIQLL